MPTAEATMSISLERPHDVQPSPSGPPPNARLRDTLVLLLAMGTVVVACGLVTVLVLHPLSGSAVVERVMAIVASL